MITELRVRNLLYLFLALPLHVFFKQSVRLSLPHFSHLYMKIVIYQSIQTVPLYVLLESTQYGVYFPIKAME